MFSRLRSHRHNHQLRTRKPPFLLNNTASTTYVVHWLILVFFNPNPPSSKWKRRNQTGHNYLSPGPPPLYMTRKQTLETSTRPVSSSHNAQ